MTVETVCFHKLSLTVLHVVFTYPTEISPYRHQLSIVVVVPHLSESDQKIPVGYVQNRTTEFFEMVILYELIEKEKEG